MAIQAVASHPLGEDAKKPAIEGAGVFLQSDPAPPTYQPPALFPDAGGSQWGAGPPATIFPTPGKWSLPEHDALTAYVLDPGFTIPKPAPSPSAPVQAAQGALTEGEMDSYLLAAGVPLEWWADFKAIAHCESRWRPEAIGDGGNSIGLMQLNRMWFAYAGTDVEKWDDPLVNIQTAWATFNYDIGRGYEPWTQWSCRKVLGR